MRYLVVLLAGLGLVGCNGPDIKVPISRFYGADVIVSKYESIKFNISGAYVYNNSKDDCVKAGTWKDLDPGSRANIINFTQEVDGCIYPNNTEKLTYSYLYKVNDKNLIELYK